MKIMAIDYGDAHTGAAISDATLTLAGYSTVINSRKADVVTAEICRLIQEHGVTELVLGYPKIWMVRWDPARKSAPPTPRRCVRPRD